jgi:hypothetical protein
MCFEASKLSWAVSENDDTFAFYRRLIALRRTWRRHGLLTVQGRSLNLDPEQETIRIRYEANSHQAWVASSRDPGALRIPESGMGRIHYRTQGSTPHRYLWIADTCSITT